MPIPADLLYVVRVTGRKDTGMQIIVVRLNMLGLRLLADLDVVEDAVAKWLKLPHAQQQETGILVLVFEPGSAVRLPMEQHIQTGEAHSTAAQIATKMQAVVIHQICLAEGKLCGHEHHFNILGQRCVQEHAAARALVIVSVVRTARLSAAPLRDVNHLLGAAQTVQGRINALALGRRQCAPTGTNCARSREHANRRMAAIIWPFADGCLVDASCYQAVSDDAMCFGARGWLVCVHLVGAYVLLKHWHLHRRQVTRNCELNPIRGPVFDNPFQPA